MIYPRPDGYFLEANRHLFDKIKKEKHVSGEFFGIIFDYDFIKGDTIDILEINQPASLGEFQYAGREINCIVTGVSRDKGFSFTIIGETCPTQI